MLNRVVNRKKPAPAASPPHDQWKLRRERHWRVLYRGKDRKLHFHGQQPDEVVRMVVRKHKWFLVQPALPLIGSIMLFLLVTAGALKFPTLGVLWVLLEASIILLIIITGAWFVWRDFIVWWFNVDIITNKRLIRWSGFMSPSRKDIPTDKIQQIALDTRDTPGEIFWGYGDLHLYIIGGEIDITQVARPKRVKEALVDITEDIKAKKKPEPVPPVPADPEIAKVLDELGKQKDKPKPPDPDSTYPPLHNDRRIGPRRTFGGPLRIVCDVHYAFGESTAMYIQHSRFVLLQRLVLPILALLVVLPLTVYIPTTPMLAHSFDALWWGFFGLLVLGLLLYIVVVYINFIDDVYILTNRRIIDIERKLMFLYEERLDIEYKNIRDIRVTLPNVVLTLLDIGNVYIETPGSSPNMVFRMVRHPLSIQDKINELKVLKEKADKIEEENKRKRELHMWFGTVITTQEQQHTQTSSSNGIPDVCGLELLVASDIASQLGLDLIVLGEEPVKTDIGKVVHQNPPRGTVMEVGGELQVWVGRRLTATDII